VHCKTQLSVNEYGLFVYMSFYAKGSIHGCVLCRCGRSVLFGEVGVKLDLGYVGYFEGFSKVYVCVVF
jgi:hypothetical protein